MAKKSAYKFIVILLLDYWGNVGKVVRGEDEFTTLATIHDWITHLFESNMGKDTPGLTWRVPRCISIHLIPHKNSSRAVSRTDRYW